MIATVTVCMMTWTSPRTRRALPEHGGSPPPGQAADRNNNRLPDDEEAPAGAPRLFGVIPLPGLLGVLANFEPEPRTKEVVPIEFQALEFEAGGAFYSGVYCYAGLGGEMGRYPTEPTQYFDRMGPRRWIIPQDLGSHPVAADTEVGLRVEAHCYGVMLSGSGAEIPPPYNLGAFTVLHPAANWNGTVFTMWPGKDDTVPGRGD